MFKTCKKAFIMSFGEVVLFFIVLYLSENNESVLLKLLNHVANLYTFILSI